MSCDLRQHKEEVNSIEAYPRYVVDPKHRQVPAPGGRASKSHRSRGPRDCGADGSDKKWIDIECTGQKAIHHISLGGSWGCLLRVETLQMEVLDVSLADCALHVLFSHDI